MNTPEHSKEENHTQVNRQHYVNRPHGQLAHSPTHPKRGRDYGRILRDCNAPAQWYQASAIPRSIYFYDPQYQRYLQQQSVTPNRRSASPVRASRQSPTRARPMVPSASNHPQTSPRLPPSLPSKPVKDE